MNTTAIQSKVAFSQSKGARGKIQDQETQEPKESFLRSEQLEGLKVAAGAGIGGALVFGIPTAIGAFASPLLAFPAVAAGTAWLCSKAPDNSEYGTDVTPGKVAQSFAMTLGLTAIGACAGAAGVIGVAALPIALGAGIAYHALTN